MSKTINIADKQVPFSKIKEGECYLHTPSEIECLYMKLSDPYHTDQNTFNITSGFLAEHPDDLMVVPVDVEINVRRR